MTYYSRRKTRFLAVQEAVSPRLRSFSSRSSSDLSTSALMLSVRLENRASSAARSSRGWTVGRPQADDARMAVETMELILMVGGCLWKKMIVNQIWRVF